MLQMIAEYASLSNHPKLLSFQDALKAALQDREVYMHFVSALDEIGLRYDQRISLVCLSSALRNAIEMFSLSSRRHNSIDTMFHSHQLQDSDRLR